MRLKLREILKIKLTFFILLLSFKDDDSSSFITKGEKFARFIELDGGDDIFLDYLLVGSFVAEQLCEFVVGAFAWY